MIESEAEYRMVQRQLDELNDWLRRLEAEQPGADKYLTLSGVRRRIARTQNDLADFESRAYVEAHAEAGSSSAHHEQQ